MSTLPPTPFPDVNETLGWFEEGVRAIAGAWVHGIYLTGSLALGDFDPESSDIDLIVVLNNDLPAALLPPLQALHAQFNASSSPWAAEIEVLYISAAALRRHDPARAHHPHIQRGRDQTLNIDLIDQVWDVQRAILRDTGVALFGPPIAPLIDPVSPAAIRQAVLRFLDTWWEPMLANPLPLRTAGYQAYAVLTMCRLRYSAATSNIASKPAAARWLLQSTPHPWLPLISHALAWRKNAPTPVASDLSLVQQFIADTIAWCRATITGSGDTRLQSAQDAAQEQIPPWG